MSDPFIWVDEAALAPAVCAQIVAQFEADPRKQAGRVVGAGTPKRSTDLGVARLSGWEPIAAKLETAVVSSAMRYRDRHPALAHVYTDVMHSGFQIQRYLPSGDEGFDWHADRINVQTADRVVAMVLYLNTVVEGGATEFREQQLVVQPRAGAALWFPPTFAYVHRGATPVGEAKYVVTTFLVER